MAIPFTPLRYHVQRRSDHYFVVRDTLLGISLAAFTDLEDALIHAARRNDQANRAVRS